MKAIRWAIPISVVLAAALVVVFAGAAPGDVIRQVRSPDVSPTAPQRAKLVAALSACTPGIPASLVDEYVCDRETGKVKCRAVGEVTVDIDQYIDLRLAGRAERATSRDGNNVTFHRRTGWRHDLSQACNDAIEAYIDDAHSGVTTAAWMYLKAWRDGGIKSHVDTFESVSPATHVDQEIAGTAPNPVGVVE